jgi:hypothetical protein
MKWPQAVGQAMYWFGRWRGSPAQIIEYNTNSATKPAVNSN